jgi:hypothetical protein
MSDPEGQPRFRRWRAPAEHGAAFIEPSRDRAGSLARNNAAALRGAKVELSGRSLQHLAAAARRDLVRQAVAYTRAYRDADLPGAGDAPIFLAGHQPQLVHPGVWFKNVVLADVAAGNGGVAINFLVDNDTIREAAIRVPGGSLDAPVAATVPFDEPSEEIPHEERRIRGRATFDSFGRRAAETIAPLVSRPLLVDFWPLATAAADAEPNLGLALAQARHVWEARWGLNSLEIPLSRLAATEPFRWFAAHLMADAPRLRDVYNQALAEFRRAHRVRSRSHPVPELEIDHGGCEVPLWMWSAADPRRRRVFVRRKNAAEIEFFDRHRAEFVLRLPADGSAETAAPQLGELEAAGLRLRPRALVTTMYARLFLGDLFVHGIGGAKYDELSNMILARFFGLTPPEYMVVSATVLLPVPRGEPAARELREVEQRLRELQFQPERFLGHRDEPRDAEGRVGGSLALPNTEIAQLIAEKKRWIATEPPRRQRRARHEALTRANELLRPYVASLREKLLGRREELHAAARREAILDGREYAFCLFPEKTLHELLLEVLLDRA